MQIKNITKRKKPMNNNFFAKIFKPSTAFILIFIIASLLRFVPAIINRDANDEHFKVIETIAWKNIIPEKDSCLQCYHPKLYHYSVAKTVNLFSIENLDDLIIAGQIINVLAGILTLYFIYLFLQKLQISTNTKILSFLLVALNPALMAINIQATNDSFVILFSTISIYYLFLFFENTKILNLLNLTISVTLAALSKGSGLIILIGVVIVFMIKIFSNFQNKTLIKKYTLFLAMFLATSISLIILFGPYDDYYFQYGTPLAINKEKSPTPNFSKKTYVGGKTGIVSVYDGYLTFRYPDLMKTLYLDRDADEGEYPPSRVSLWTQLYAQSNFIQYTRRPLDWKVKLTNPVYSIGKMTFVVALIPFAIFLIGIFISTKISIASFAKNKLSYLKNENDWIMAFFFWTFIAFIIKFTLDYREFSAMKPIYIYPAILSFVFMFAIGFDWFLKKFKNIYFIYAVYFVFTSLSVLYALNIFYLVVKLIN